MDRIRKILAKSGDLFLTFRSLGKIAQVIEDELFQFELTEDRKSIFGFDGYAFVP